VPAARAPKTGLETQQVITACPPAISRAAGEHGGLADDGVQGSEGVSGPLITARREKTLKRS
jgi:hypothetical protein